MPKAEERKRGGVVRYRTIKPSADKYMHVAITKEKGPRGGKTVAGEVHTKKKRTK